jgi:hypothetical protein
VLKVDFVSIPSGASVERCPAGYATTIDGSALSVLRQRNSSWVIVGQIEIEPSQPVWFSWVSSGGIRAIQGTNVPYCEDVVSRHDRTRFQLNEVSLGSYRQLSDSLLVGYGNPGFFIVSEDRGTIDVEEHSFLSTNYPWLFKHDDASVCDVRLWDGKLLLAVHEGSPEGGSVQLVVFDLESKTFSSSFSVPALPTTNSRLSWAFSASDEVCLVAGEVESLIVPAQSKPSVWWLSLDPSDRSWTVEHIALQYPSKPQKGIQWTYYSASADRSERHLVSLHEVVDGNGSQIASGEFLPHTLHSTDDGLVVLVRPR